MGRKGKEGLPGRSSNSWKQKRRFWRGPGWRSQVAGEEALEQRVQVLSMHYIVRVTETIIINLFIELALIQLQALFTTLVIVSFSEVGSNLRNKPLTL